MRGWMFLAIIFILSVAVAAQNQTACDDTDAGGARASDKALTVKGIVKYGLTSQTDTCLTAEDGVSAASGVWLKEYYCSSGQRMSHAYDCIKLGYTKCENGACIGGKSTTSNTTSSNQTTTTSKPVEACGNKILEKKKGEECDPPGSICFGKTAAEYGTCRADCTCQISAAALKNVREQPPVCGDGYRHDTEDCEEDADCPKGYVCSSCKCVKKLTAAEIAAMKEQASEKKEVVSEETSKEVEDKYKYEAPEVPEVEAKNFTEEPAIKATGGIARFFKSIFGWLVDLFS